MTGLGSSCGACKFLRRKCASDCVFAPYFCYDEAATHFAAVHKVFGASNVSKLLSHLPVQNRSDAAITISYEALARMLDPVYGCVAHIFALQQQVARLQEEIDILGSQMATVASCTTAGYGSSQATLNPICMQQFHSQEHVMNTQHSQNQPAALLNYSGFTTGIQAFDSQMDVQLPALYRWEELNPFCDYQENPLEGVLEGIDKEILSYCSWFDSTN